MGKKKRDYTLIISSIFLVGMGAFLLMLLTTNIDYYIGETLVVRGVAVNWSTFVTILLSVSIIPVSYIFLRSQFKNIAKKR